MNQLEKTIIEGTRTAQREYESMTNWWLSHGPESFLMCSVASKVAQKGGFSVFVEASPKKILKERDEQRRGRPSANLGQRFDIVVWQKSSCDIRAIIEVKRAWSIADLRDDRKKIANYMSSNVFVRAGYLLAYTEANGKNRQTKITDRFTNWCSELSCELACSFIDGKGDGEWGWAAGLFRLL
jgi:hypothetical protein